MDREAKFLEFIQNGEEPFMYERDILFDHWERVKEVMAGRNTNPYEIELQPTNRCNLHCTHCVGVAHKPKDVIEISPERMKEIIKKIHKRGGVKRVKFSGYYGEPLMNSKSVLIGIREAKKKGMKVGLFTNGTLLNEGIMSAIMGIEYVNISLDAGSRESYQKLKGSDQFNRVISNIRMLDALRKSRKSRLEITVGYILNRDNYREIPQMVKTLKNHIDILRFKANILNSDMTKEELDEAYRFIGESKEHETKGFRIISIHSRMEAERSKKPEFGRCYFLNFMGCVGCDGKEYPCDHKTYFGGDKKDLVPERDCELCPPMGFRINKFLKFLEEEYAKDPKFLEWVENYLKRESK